MRSSSPRPPNEAQRRESASEPDGGTPEATSQPGLSRKELELPDGRYLLAYERTRVPDDA